MKKKIIVKKKTPAQPSFLPEPTPEKKQEPRTAPKHNEDWIAEALERLRGVPVWFKDDDFPKGYIPFEWNSFPAEDVRNQLAVLGKDNAERLFRGEAVDRNVWFVIARGGKLYWYDNPKWGK